MLLQPAGAFGVPQHGDSRPTAMFRRIWLKLNARVNIRIVYSKAPPLENAKMHRDVQCTQ